MAIDSWFTHQKWWFSVVMLVYQRVWTWHDIPNHWGIGQTFLQRHDVAIILAISLTNASGHLAVWLCGLCIWATMNPQNDVPSSFLVRSESTFPSSGWFGDGHMPVSPRMYRFYIIWFKQAIYRDAGWFFLQRIWLNSAFARQLICLRGASGSFLPGMRRKWRVIPLAKL